MTQNDPKYARNCMKNVGNYIEYAGNDMKYRLRRNFELCQLPLLRLEEISSSANFLYWDLVDPSVSFSKFQVTADSEVLVSSETINDAFRHLLL